MRRATAGGDGLGGTTPLALDLVAILAAALLYVAIARPRAAGPLQTIAVPLALSLGALGLTALAAATHDGIVDPKTALPMGTAANVWTATLGTVEVVLAAVVLSSLRPLALHRRRRPTNVAWGILLTLILVSGVLLIGRTVTEPYPDWVAVPVVGTIMAAAGLALRQRWIVTLTSGQRLAAAALALVLCATLSGLVYAQMDGPALLLVGDGTGAVRAVPHVAVLSPPLAAIVLLSLTFGGLYALAAGLTLLLGPSADAQVQRAGERKALRSLADLSGRLLDRSELAAAVASGPVASGVGDAAWVAFTDPDRGVVTPQVAAAQGLSVGDAARAVDVDALYRAAVDAGGILILRKAEADHRVRSRPGDGISSLVALSLGGSNGHGPGQLTRGVLFVSRASNDPFEP
ncbi:MAG: hypothetical protein AAGK21_01390, partial [Bacteroidota bacterium]